MWTSKPFHLFQNKSRSINMCMWCLGSILLVSLSTAYSMEPLPEDEIDTLEVMEITGSVIEQLPRNMSFPIPELSTDRQMSSSTHLLSPAFTLHKPMPTSSRILLDHTAKNRTLHTPVRPLNTAHPTYPRRAREQGWHGRIIVRVTISDHGKVESVSIQKSSEYKILDDQALDTARQWTFKPAKNGIFPVDSTVDIPIQFNLVQ